MQCLTVDNILHDWRVLLTVAQELLRGIQGLQYVH
jgi:hypothetical protein